MKLAVLIPDGVGLRNFAGVFLKHFNGEATLFHEAPGAQVEKIVSGAAARVKWAQLIVPPERPLSFTLRQTLTFAHVYWGDTKAMRYTRARRLRGSWKTVAANRTAKLVGRMAATRHGIRLLESTYFRAMESSPEIEHYRRMFTQQTPDVVLSSSQQSPKVLLPILAAKSLGIPTVAFVASWDNLTSKGRIAAPFDHFLVWSEHMKGELLRLYPDVSPDRVHVVGSPQFDPYADTSLLWTREVFLRKIGADPSRPLICYSGGDETSCPDDQEHVRVLMQAVRSGAVRGNPQVLVRPCPVDPGTRYDAVRRDYPELLFAQPDWVQPVPGAWAPCIPTLDDVQFLANLTHHADVNVNLASTMTLDFSIRDKPVINLAFDVTSPPPMRVPLWDLYYQWEHYAPVVRLGAARIARSPEQLTEHVNAALANPATDRDGRRKLVELQVGAPIGTAGVNITHVLSRIARALSAKTAA
jgi:hypothetical protein